MYREAALDRLLSGSRPSYSADTPYDSRFTQWEERASVRRRPRRTLEAEGSSLYFPPELYPIVLHPLVRARGPEAVRTLLAQRLYDYLEFTTELETLAVIPIATKISRGRAGLALPAQMRADAFKIVTDEAWHAQFSNDFARQLAHVSKVIPSSTDAVPAFLDRLDRLREALPAELRGVESLLFAIVSETLISGVLSDIPRDERLPRSVRDLVRDHAEDEGRHHVYFRSLLRHLWTGLNDRERRAVSRLVPSVIMAFLEPDYEQTAAHLQRLGFTPEEAGCVISESWPAPELLAGIADAARPAVRYFVEAGALEDPGTRDAFVATGLEAALANGSDT